MFLIIHDDLIGVCWDNESKQNNLMLLIIMNAKVFVECTLTMTHPRLNWPDQGTIV